MDILDKALEYAIEKHSGQIRKRNRVPYILHPLEVVTIIGTLTDDKEVMCAGALHDTVEDAGVTISEIEELFGEKIAKLVATETEDKMANLPPEDTWKLRKENSLKVLKNATDINVKILWLADKLSNMRSFYRLYLKEGSALWNGFNNKDESEQCWYYKCILEYISPLKGTPAYEEYKRLFSLVFASQLN